MVFVIRALEYGVMFQGTLKAIHGSLSENIHVFTNP